MNADEELRLREIADDLERASEWHDLWGGERPSESTRVRAGSDLDLDDKAAHPYQVSHAAWAAMVAAVNHLLCLRESLVVQKDETNLKMRLHTHGQCTLMRGALENASSAVWLLESDDHQQRILRRLQQARAEMADLDKVREMTGQPPPRSTAVRLGELADLARSAGIDPRDIRQKTQYGTIVGAAGKHVLSDADAAVVLWKICSALAHGETTGMLAYLDMRVVAQASPGVALAGVTANVSLIRAGVGTAVRTTQLAHDLYARRAGNSV